MPEYHRVEEMRNLGARLVADAVARRVTPKTVDTHWGQQQVPRACATRDQRFCIIDSFCLTLSVMYLECPAGIWPHRCVARRRKDFNDVK